ncbi:MAG: RHS repeat-associated core domain-containing protein [Myxococcota bacterium]|nr:RHS repeat-associated core domain-containing protein [Myxococcota bacterium]
MTDQSARVQERVEYYPYGEVWREDKEERRGNLRRTQQFLYTSKELDEETGLTYFGARYYDSKKARWASTDPAFLEQGAIGLSPYHYAGWNPIRNIDPDGRVWGTLSPEFRSWVDSRMWIDPDVTAAALDPAQVYHVARALPEQEAALRKTGGEVEVLSDENGVGKHEIIYAPDIANEEMKKKFGIEQTPEELFAHMAGHMGEWSAPAQPPSPLRPRDKRSLRDPQSPYQHRRSADSENRERERQGHKPRPGHQPAGDPAREKEDQLRQLDSKSKPPEPPPSRAKPDVQQR